MTPEEIGRLRVGDAEREQAVAALGDHYTLGRLNDREYNERLDAVWSSKTRADLDVLFHDLPTAPPALAVPVPAPSPRIPGPVLAVLAVVGVVLVASEPFLFFVLLVLTFVLVKRHRQRARRAAGERYWR